jgi:hypothetical protein
MSDGRKHWSSTSKSKCQLIKKALFAPPHAASYVYYAAENLISEPGLKRPDLPPFGPFAADEAPKRFETEKIYKTLGSLIVLNGRVLAADATLKEIIERFEPDVHNFSPLEIVMPKKIVYPKQYSGPGSLCNSRADEQNSDRDVVDDKIAIVLQ